MGTNVPEASVVLVLPPPSVMVPPPLAVLMLLLVRMARVRESSLFLSWL